MSFLIHDRLIQNSYLWGTDLHLDEADSDLIDLFYRQVSSLSPKALFISGDIGSAPNIEHFLNQLEKYAQCPIYFVLGNHDFYGSSIGSVREKATQLTQSNPHHTYLHHSPPLALSKQTALIGVDGWSDGLEGDFLNSTVTLRDYQEITELRDLSKEERLSRLKELGKESAKRLHEKIEQSFQIAEQVIILTHPSPFRESCLYNGSRANQEWAPHFICQQVGTVLTDTMKKHSDKDAIVLCGHCHASADVKILPNLRVICGHAQSGKPKLQRSLTIEPNHSVVA